MRKQIGNNHRGMYKYALVVCSVLKIPALYAAVMTVMTYPWIFHLNDRLPSNWQSPPYVSVMLNNHNAFLSSPLRILDAGYFYPIKNSIALTENLIGYTIFFSPFYVLTNNPIFSFNMMIWLFFVLSATSIFLLIKYFLNSSFPAFVAGLIYGFSSYRFGNIDDIHMVNLMCLPLAALFLEKGIETGKWRFFALLAACFVFQVYSGLYLSAFLALYLLIFTIFHTREILATAVFKKILTAALVSILLISPLVYMYIDIRISYAYKQWENTLQWLGMDVVDYVRVMDNNVLYNSILINQKSDILRRFCAFPGLLAVVLAVYGVFSKSLKGKSKGMLLAIAIVTFLFSLGPYLKFNNELTRIPLPYLLVVKIVSYIRCSWRYVFPFMFSLACLSALGLHKILAKVGKIKALLITSVVSGIILLENLNFPMYLYKAEAPDNCIYSLIDAPLIEYPSKLVEGTGDPFFKDYWKREYLYMFYQAYHRQKIVNGAVSYNPSPRFETNELIGNIPSDEALKYFSSLGIKYIAVHKDMFLKDERPYSAKDFDLAGLSKMKETQDIVLFKIDKKVRTCEDVRVEWDLIGKNDGSAFLGMTFVPIRDCPWVNPKQSKIEKVRLKIFNKKNVMLTSKSMVFSLPLVLMEEKEYMIPAGNVDMEGEFVAVLDFEDSHFRYENRKDLRFRSP